MEAPFTEKLKNWAERSTFHAVPNFTQTDRVSVKILWAVCLILSSSYCAKVLIVNTIEYMRHNVETVIKIERESDASFPTVTICYSQVCTNEEEAYNINLDLERFKALGYANIFENKDNATLISKANKNIFMKNSYYVDKLRNILVKYNQTRSIRDYLISCLYSSEYCYENDFEYYQLGDNQRCFKFNSGKTMNNEVRNIRKARRYGKNYGLQLELAVGLQDKCNLPFTGTFGLTLYVHNSTYTVSEDMNAIQLSPGTETNIAIDRTFVNRMPEPYSDCVQVKERPGTFRSRSVDRTFNFTQNYSQQTCMQLCYQSYLIKNKHCYDVSLPKTAEDERTSVPCPKLLEFLMNPNLTLVDSSQFYESGANADCQSECPTECEFVTYDTTISSSQFPTITYNEILVRNENITGTLGSPGTTEFNTIKNSILSVNVFYRSDMFQRIKEKPAVEDENFVSSIGGAFGLFWGISILSFVEFVEILLELLIHGYKRKTYVRPAITSKQAQMAAAQQQQQQQTAADPNTGAPDKSQLVTKDPASKGSMKD